MDDLVDLVRQTLSWRGRASRRTLLMSVALLMLFGLAVLPLVVALSVFGTGPIRWAVALVVVPLGIAEMYLLVGAVIRRLHDRGTRGWWLLLFFGPHVALTAVLGQVHDTNSQTLILAGGLLVDAPFLVWGLVEILLMPSKRGPNMHGPGSQAPSDAIPVSAQG